MSNSPLLAKMVENFNTTYETFLKSEGLPDKPVVKVGFFAALEQIARRDPYPVPAMQMMILNHLRRVQHTCWDEYLEKAEMIFVDISMRSMVMNVSSMKPLS